MRRWAALALLVTLLSLVTGCWSRIEINDLAIVSMMALDRTEDGQVQVWVHVPVPTRVGGIAGAGGSGGGEKGGRSYITMSAKGRSMLDTIRKIQMQLPRRLFWAHMRVILVGERLARDGLGPTTDFLTRFRELRLTDYILLVRGSMAEMMESEVDLEKLPVEYLYELERARAGTTVNLSEFIRLLVAHGADPVMGIATVAPPPPGAPPQQKPSLRLSGTALFQDDKLVGFLNDHLTRGLLWLRGEMQQGFVTVSLPDIPGTVSLQWFTAKVTRTARVEGGKPVIYVTARSEADIAEVEAPIDLSDPASLALIEQAANQEFQRRIQQTLTEMRTLNVDAAGFGEVVRQHQPVVWHRLEKQWLRVEAKRVKVVVQVDMRIRRTGLSSKPRAVREEDLIKVGE